MHSTTFLIWVYKHVYNIIIGFNLFPVELCLEMYLQCFQSSSLLFFSKYLKFHSQIPLKFEVEFSTGKVAFMKSRVDYSLAIS